TEYVLPCVLRTSEVRNPRHAYRLLHLAPPSGGSSSAELLSQVEEIVGNDVVCRIGHWIGWATGAPFCGTPHEGTAIAHSTCGHEVEVVAGHHHNLAGLQGEPPGGGLICFRERLVDTDHLAGDDAVPDNIVVARHI